MEQISHDIQGYLAAKQILKNGVDIICAGFPCQDISHAGKQKGLSGTNSGLFWDMLDTIRMVRPKYVLLENVAAILGNGLPTVLGEMATLGYDSEWNCIPACAIGAPHRRDRAWMLFSNAKNVSRSKADTKTVSIRKRRPSWSLSKHSYWEDTPRPNWSVCESRVSRVANGVSNRVHRNRALGNTIVPHIAELILSSIKKERG